MAQSQSQEIDQLVRTFLLQPLTPQATWQFENAVADRLRELGRGLVEEVYNGLEADARDDMPKHIEQEGQPYSRKNEKTKNREGIGTLFGKIPRVRFSYEPLSEARDNQQKSISPLELSLGIVAANATPALAERVGRAASGHTQRELLELLEREHRVRWSAKVLRQVTAAVSAGVAEHLHQAQKEQLLDWLREADSSKGRCQITLGVGRDGIMLPIRGEKTYKEGAVATVTVCDRRGRRLGTVYLGQMPEAYQTTLSEERTRLLEELLEDWNGRWPRLVYITDAGYHPTEYYDNVLTQREHPRHPGRLLLTITHIFVAGAVLLTGVLRRIGMRAIAFTWRFTDVCSQSFVIALFTTVGDSCCRPSPAYRRATQYPLRLDSPVLGR